MDKLKMQTENIVDENVAFIEQRFPNCVVEAKDEQGKITKMVDFDLLKQELSKVVVDGDKERYQMTWPDKKQAILTANSPIAKTLRPCKEKSVGKDGTCGGWDSQNIYIEGDNLDVLKVLRETYLGKVKMIYIDPPYNTGNDFVYNDDFATDTDEYLERSNQVDEQGNRMVTNSDSNGRFHTDWLNMMYPRLKVAKDLLTDDGFIIISIDGNEENNLQKICNEIFGEKNLLVNTVVNRTSEIATNYTIYKHEYALVYTKNMDTFSLQAREKYSVSRGTVGNADQTMPIIEFPAGLECKNIKDGTYNETRKIEGSSENIENFDPIVVENGRLKYPVKLKARWRSSNDMRNFFANNCQPTQAKINGEIVEIYFENDRFNPQIKKKTYEKISSMYLDNKRGSEDLKKLGMENYFDFPKNVDFIKYLLSFTKKDAIIMDFFSGSATTAHAMIKLNCEDAGKRQFILVQLPELINENNPAYREGYRNICELGEERIRRAGQKIIEEQASLNNAFKQTSFEPMKAYAEFTTSEKALAEQKNVRKWLDVGFRVFKLDSSNMKDTYYKPSEYSFNLLDSLDENIKPDRTPEDLLFQVMLDLGLMLDSKIEEKNINGKKVFIVGEYNEMVKPDLICCFDSNVDNNTVTEIAKMQPRFAVFRDSSMAKDSVEVNFDQIFETYSPSTTRKVL